MTNPCTKRTLLPYQRPFRNPFNTGSKLRLIQLIQVCENLYKFKFFYLIQNQLLSKAYILIMRILSLLTRNICRFSGDKKKSNNLHQYLKKKKISESNKELQLHPESAEQFVDPNKFLYYQYIPAAILFLPAFYYLPSPTETIFISSCNIVQYYSSGLLCFNALFSADNIKKYIPFLVSVGLINCLTGPISILSPLLLGILNVSFPYTQDKYHKEQEEKDINSYKVYIDIQAIYYILVALVTIFKTYHYFQVDQIQRKLSKFDSQNKKDLVKK